MATPLQSTALDETLDAPLAPTHSVSVTPQRVALVEGSTPHMSRETQLLLRGRLRAAAIVLFAGFAAFLVRGLLMLDDYFSVALGPVLLGLHIFVTAVTGLMSVGLCRRCAISLTRLRFCELVIFGAPAVFFLLMQYAETLAMAQEGFLEAVPNTWILLMFTYALFVPNTWQRAGAVVSAMAIAALSVYVYVYWTDATFAALLQNPHHQGYFTAVTMFLMLAVAAATYGVAMIGTLRRQVFVAKQLGQYRLKKLIGGGGMGEVYLGEHQLMKRPCAIKVIRPEKAGDPQVLARFEREVRETAKLSHWNTVEIFDYGRSDDGTFYYVMEYLPGLSLNDLVNQHGPLPPERVIHLLTQTCEALSEAHSHKLIHRDLKPGNIFAAQRGGIYDVAKLLDFGLVKPLAETESAGLTQEGSITGSPLYMSPEQAAGDDVFDPRSDIYSLGAVAYFMLTGQPPFDNEKPLKVMIAHIHDPVVPPSQLRDGIPEDLELVVLRCLAKRPEDRYQDAESLRQALAQCESAGSWDRELAALWWHQFGCPKKQALDAVAMHQLSHEYV